MPEAKVTEATRTASIAVPIGRRGSLRVLLAGLAAIGCGLADAAAQTSIPVKEPPPPEKHEPIPPEPLGASDLGYRWQVGHWRWLGRGWVWSPGRWAEVPYRGARWVPGTWLERSYGWVWQPGYWYDIRAALDDPLSAMTPAPR